MVYLRRSGVDNISMFQDETLTIIYPLADQACLNKKTLEQALVNKMFIAH